MYKNICRGHLNDDPEQQYEFQVLPYDHPGLKPGLPYVSDAFFREFGIESGPPPKAKGCRYPSVGAPMNAHSGVSFPPDLHLFDECRKKWVEASKTRFGTTGFYTWIIHKLSQARNKGKQNWKLNGQEGAIKAMFQYANYFEEIDILFSDPAIEKYCAESSSRILKESIEGAIVRSFINHMNFVTAHVPRSAALIERLRLPSPNLYILLFRANVWKDFEEYKNAWFQQY